MALIHQLIPLDARWLDPLCELLCKDVKAQFNELQEHDADAAAQRQRALIDKLVSLSPSVALMLCRSHVALPWKHLLWLLQHRDVDTDIRNVHFGRTSGVDEKVWTLLSHPRVQSLVAGISNYYLAVRVRNLSLLCSMTSLQSLTFRLGEWDKLTKHDLSFLSSLPRLTSLRIGNWLKDGAFEGLAGSLTNLKYLSLKTHSARFMDDVPSLKTSLTRLEGDVPPDARQSCLGLQFIRIGLVHPCFKSPDPLAVFPALCTAKTIYVYNYSRAAHPPLERLLTPRVPLAVEALQVYGGSLSRDALTGFPCLASLTYLKLSRVTVEPGHEEALTHPALTALKWLTVDGECPQTVLRHITAPIRELELFYASGRELVQACPVPVPYASTLTSLVTSALTAQGLGHPVSTHSSPPLLAQLTALRDVRIKILDLETVNPPLLPLIVSSRLMSLEVNARCLTALTLTNDQITTI